jgi:hypothetical protein
MYCASKKEIGPDLRLPPMQQRSLRCLEVLFVSTLSAILSNAKMDSIAGFVLRLFVQFAVVASQT